MTLDEYFKLQMEKQDSKLSLEEQEKLKYYENEKFNISECISDTLKSS